MAQKSLRVLKLLWILSDRVVYKCHSDSVLFRFFIDQILFGVLSDKVLFAFSVNGSASGSTVIDSPLGSSMLFFRHVAIFLSKRAIIFFNQKQMFCFKRKIQYPFKWIQLIEWSNYLNMNSRLHLSNKLKECGKFL